MFLSRNKKNNVYPCKPQIYYIKVGFKGVKIISACFRDVWTEKGLYQHVHLHSLIRSVIMSEYRIQSTLIVLTSLVPNYRLSRSEILVPV